MLISLPTTSYAPLDGAAGVALAWNERGAIGTPCSVSTRQIGATPKRSLWSAMNTQIELASDGCAGRFPARRKTLPP
ncbi:uncharacterized protein RMCN_6000 [Mycolicibacterium novocastrense]|uniref:Uncharacterized protein n=1 Tax=Mycolicibacterium novocastrense TaxID=59813 RepID=A0ABQ0KU69_MYCNV|nr:uncharacterized protein RMCN_6000 [Mycolicibacterium novocastrense]